MLRWTTDGVTYQLEVSSLEIETRESIGVSMC